MVCQLWPLVVSLGLTKPPHIDFTPVNEVALKKDTVPRTGKLLGWCKMAGTGFHSVVANRAQMRTAYCHEENNPTPDCHRQESKFESGLPRGYSCCGKLRYWSAVCHKRVKSRTGYQPFTSIPYSTVPLFAAPYCFDARLCKGLADCLPMSKLYGTSIVSVCHTISWHYTLKHRFHHLFIRDLEPRSEC
jgi:hypothetical protein